MSDEKYVLVIKCQFCRAAIHDDPHKYWCPTTWDYSKEIP